MGVVYLGAAGDDSLVAVKVLRPELADDPEFRARFSHEVAALARVKGVCTVRMIEADTESSAPFMVTEYAAGPSLSEYVEQHGPVGADMLYGLATGLAEALTAIHAAGVVHRDLKPSNVILSQDSPKVIDFGIARALDATWLTKTGMLVGSAGFMAPEQVTGRAGQAADIFAWAVTLAYAASGQMPFGTGLSEAILYRILHAEPDIDAVPYLLRPLVEAALVKDPQRRPAAHELLARLTSPSARSEPGPDRDTGAVLARTWPGTEPGPVQQVLARESLLLEPAPPGPARRRAARDLVRRRPAAVGASAVAVVAVAALVLAMVTGHLPSLGQLTAKQQPNQDLATAALGTYPGQQPRGVFQAVSRIVASGSTVVAMGSQASDDVLRQQFFVSADGGVTWRLAPLHASGGGPVPPGYLAARLAGGPGGWLAAGRQAVWTSRDGLSWTLAATHGITPQLRGDRLLVINSTASGFLAAGQAAADGGGTQGVIWTSRDGLSWQRMTAAQLGLAGPGETVQDISYAASRGADTLISGTVASGGTIYAGVWLSTDGGSTWTRVTVPADHGAGTSLAGLAFDGSGLLAVRPGLSASGTNEGISYFSPNGRDWQYSGTIGAAPKNPRTGGWTPSVVKGGDDGFVVTGTTAGGQVVAYVAAGAGTAWQPTGSLGSAAGESVTGAAVGAGRTVIAVGATAGSKVSQQPVFLEANTAGSVRPVSLAGIPGATVPELAVNALAAAGGEQIAVGSANGYPAVWRQASAGSSWTLASTLSLVSADPGLSALTSVTHGPAGWLAVGVPGPVVLTSADGISWQRAGGTIAADLAGSSAVAAAAGPAGYVIAAKPGAPGGGGATDVWWSPGLTSWTRGTDMNDSSGPSQVLAVAASTHGFMAVGSQGGHPAVWATTDDRTWTTIVLGLPAGASAAALQQVAINGDRVAALGRETTAGGTVAFAELSADDGASWQRAPFGPAGTSAVITALTIGSGGLTAATRSGPPGRQDAAIWTSASGTHWTPVQVAGLSSAGASAITALVQSGSAVTGIGSIATQQAQQPVTLTLPAGSLSPVPGAVELPPCGMKPGFHVALSRVNARFHSAEWAGGLITSATTQAMLSGPPPSLARPISWPTACSGSPGALRASRMTPAPTTAVRPSEHSR
jgi:hypothetical protein